MQNINRTKLARNFRRRQSDAERKLWSKLRSRQFDNIKFRRQEPLGQYIVDFVSFENKLIIEIDGGQHNESPAIEKDQQRTAWLEGAGFSMVRFWNNDVLFNIEGVIARIVEILNTPS